MCIRDRINGRFKNTNGRAPWSSGFRVVNQTAKCTGPNVVIFKDVPDEMDDQLVGPPDEWLRRDANGGAFVVFAVSKGTLVPVLAPAQLENLSLRRLMAESHGACSPVADRAAVQKSTAGPASVRPAPRTPRTRPTSPGTTPGPALLGGVTEPGRSPGSAPPPLAPGFGRRPWSDFPV